MEGQGVEGVILPIGPQRWQRAGDCCGDRWGLLRRSLGIAGLAWGWGNIWPVHSDRPLTFPGPSQSRSRGASRRHATGAGPQGLRTGGLQEAAGGGRGSAGRGLFLTGHDGVPRTTQTSPHSTHSPPPTDGSPQSARNPLDANPQPARQFSATSPRKHCLIVQGTLTSTAGRHREREMAHAIQRARKRPTNTTRFPGLLAPSCSRCCPLSSSPSAHRPISHQHSTHLLLFAADTPDAASSRADRQRFVASPRRPGLDSNSPWLVVGSGQQAHWASDQAGMGQRQPEKQARNLTSNTHVHMPQPEKRLRVHPLSLCLARPRANRLGDAHFSARPAPQSCIDGASTDKTQVPLREREHDRAQQVPPKLDNHYLHTRPLSLATHPGHIRARADTPTHAHTGMELGEIQGTHSSPCHHAVAAPPPQSRVASGGLVALPGLLAAAPVSFTDSPLHLGRYLTKRGADVRTPAESLHHVSGDGTPPPPPPPSISSSSWSLSALLLLAQRQRAPPSRTGEHEVCTSAWCTAHTRARNK